MIVTVEIGDNTASRWLALLYYGASKVGYMWLGLWDIIFPPRCVGCGQRGAWLCDACQARVQRVGPHHCQRCDRVATQSPCPACAWMTPALHGIRIVGDYAPPLKDAIWALKFKGQQQLAIPLGQLLAVTWRERGTAVDALIPVPMSPERLRQRGYNAAEIIAQRCSQRLGTPLWRDSVHRTRTAPPQRGLDAIARRHNVSGLFACDTASARRIQGKRLLIVDDVTTTGATIDAIAATLVEAGAVAVWGLALARPLVYKDHL